jgi:predicted membrane-bound spermidine synthase
MDRRAADSFNVRTANTAMAIGAAVGIVPGILLGQQARYEENDKARSAVLLLDVVGTLALGFGYAMSHSRLTF